VDGQPERFLELALRVAFFAGSFLAGAAFLAGVAFLFGVATFFFARSAS
jgi:hypothetical protein